MTVPACFYVMSITVVILAVSVNGPASKLVMVGLLLAITQLYFLLFPLFLPVPQACYCLPARHLGMVTADHIMKVTFVCRNPLAAQLYMWEQFSFNSFVLRF